MAAAIVRACLAMGSMKLCQRQIRARGRRGRGRFEGNRQPAAFQAEKPPVQHLDLGVAQPDEQVIASARLAVTAVHRVFVKHRRFIARKTGAAQCMGKRTFQFLQPFRRGRGQKREHLRRFTAPGI